MGNDRMKLVPLPGSLVTSILPPSLSTWVFVTNNPSPVSFPGSFVVKKGSNIFPLISPGMPGPVSLNTILTSPSTASPAPPSSRFRPTASAISQLHRPCTAGVPPVVSPRRITLKEARLPVGTREATRHGRLPDSATYSDWCFFSRLPRVHPDGYYSANQNRL